MIRFLLFAMCLAPLLRAEIIPESALLFLDFKNPNSPVRLFNGAVHTNGVLRFSTQLQYAEVTNTPSLGGISALSIGAWVYPHRIGEQYFFFRGVPEIDDWGRRFFRPNSDWINFVLGTDQRGFFMATAHGNSFMPFPHVTVNELSINTWHQLAYVKRADGFQEFYCDGSLIHTDTNSTSAGKINPFREYVTGEPIRLAASQGGQIGEAWLFRRELSAQEVADDFQAKKAKYNPAFAAQPVLLREMTPNPASTLWPQPLTVKGWPAHRERIQSNALQILGKFPTNRVALEPRTLSETDCGKYWRRKISFQVQSNDRMPAYLLVPKNLRGRVPVIICWYGTSGGAGKDSTAGLSGRNPGSKPHPNISFAIDFAESGFVAVAPDWLRDGERIKPGHRPYDTTDFYREFSDWSLHGKDVWDTSRLIDYLQTLQFVDPDRIGLVGHSYGGHSAIFAAALEPRVKTVVANGPVSDFLNHGPHWGVPKGAGSSQSLPNMRPYVLDRMKPPPITFYEFTALIAPRPLLVGQAAGEHRPIEEENCAAIHGVYRVLGMSDRVRYHWYAGDHDFPPEARQAAVIWFQRWLGNPAL